MSKVLHRCRGHRTYRTGLTQVVKSRKVALASALNFNRSSAKGYAFDEAREQMKGATDMNDRTHRTHKKARFLACLRKGNTVAGAAAVAGIARSTAYEWRRNDSDFAREWDDAIEVGTDSIEDALLDKALRMDSAESVTAAIFLLKARRPQKYCDKHQRKYTKEIVISQIEIERTRNEIKNLLSRYKDIGKQGT